MSDCQTFRMVSYPGKGLGDGGGSGRGDTSVSPEQLSYSSFGLDWSNHFTPDLRLRPASVE